MKALQIYSRPQCHLCEQVLEELLGLIDGRDFSVEMVDISGDLELLERYRLRIPVLCCDGEEISDYPLDLDRVIEFLRD